jgi:hypothetical protein
MFKVKTAVLLQIQVFWNMRHVHSFIGSNILVELASAIFGWSNISLKLPVRSRQSLSPKRRYLYANLRGLITQKTEILNVRVKIMSI